MLAVYQQSVPIVVKPFCFFSHPTIGEKDEVGECSQSLVLYFNVAHLFLTFLCRGEGSLKRLVRAKE